MVYDRLVVEPSEGLPVWEPVMLRDEVRIPGLRWSIKVCSGVTRDVVYEGEDAVSFDARFISLPLEVRPWQEGDRMVPFGRSGAVKLKRIFTDRKVPSRMRRYWPLVCKGDEIIWIAGLVRSNAAPVTAKTRKVTILTLLRGEDGQ
ncbi:tRNA lysidine(34) synthetase TilS [candidate division WOR-3 bacterium]|nr:tRNA lysidine(34) synthetase TilS [candidate division WOR-3 bacterium]